MCCNSTLPTLAHTQAPYLGGVALAGFLTARGPAAPESERRSQHGSRQPWVLASHSHPGAPESKGACRRRGQWGCTARGS
jgi:hypothetical protein